MSQSGAQPVRWSNVPGQEPIRLVASYPEFDFHYPDCELETKAWFTQHVQRDWVVLDVGANVGIYSLLAARLAPEGHVHAFEPTSTAAMLRANLEAAGAANVTVHETAVGCRAGDLEEPIHRLWGAPPERRIYRFTTIDQFVADHGLARLDLIKIDVDGFDLEALHGARRTLRRFDPWVVVELNQALATRGLKPGDAVAWLQSMGYPRARLALDGENHLYRRRPLI